MFLNVKKAVLIGIGLGTLGGTSLFAAEKKAVVKVYGMDCQACANGVAGSLKNLNGVKSAEVSAKEGQAVVLYDDGQVNEDQIRKQIEKSGFSTMPKPARKDETS